MIDWKAARFQYETSGITQTELAQELGCTPQAVSKRAKKEGWGRVDQKVVKVVEDLPVCEPRAGSALGKRSADNIAQLINVYAVTGRKSLASRVVGITPETLANWCREDTELLALLDSRRHSFLVDQYNKIADSKDWKAAKELLARAKETKEDWAEERKESPTIILDIRRDEVTIKDR